MTDRYTKVVLTVIAAALVALVTQGAIGPSRAQLNEVQKVQICDGLTCAMLVPADLSRRNWVVPVAPLR